MRVLLIILCAILSSCSKTQNIEIKQDMTDLPGQWQFFPCSMGDDQAFIFLNTGIAKIIDSAPPALTKLRLEYKAPRPDGLPTNEEFESVSKIENRIESFAGNSHDWYVGRVTVAGYRIFYIYTNRDESVWNDFVGELETTAGYKIQFLYEEDPEHKGYREDLYPTEDDWQVIRDLQVIENLERHGDDGSATRKVDHWIYFDDKSSSIDFLAWATSDRFVEDTENSHSSDDGRYCVRLSHHGTMALRDITSHTIALRHKAAEHGGDYDGWETQVMKTEDNRVEGRF